MTNWSKAIAQARATWTAAFLFLYIFIIGTPFLIYVWLTAKIDPLYRIGWLGARLALRIGGVRLHVGGAKNIPRGQICIYMANHQSNVDPPALFVVLPPRIALMGKKEVFSIPVLGPALRLAGFMPVDRANPEAARESVERALEQVQKGTTYLVFPEGTRSPDGRLQRFKHGVFVLAIRAGIPIVPITVDGGDVIMPKKKWQLRPGSYWVTIHPPVATAGLSLEDRAALAQRVREIVASSLPAEKRGESVAFPVCAENSPESFPV